MTDCLKVYLSYEIVDIIKLYTGEGIWRNGVYVNRIPKYDYRYTMLKNRPIIKQIYNCDFRNKLRGCVWFKLKNGKFIVINVLETYHWAEGKINIHGYFWEMHYNGKTTTIYLGA